MDDIKGSYELISPGTYRLRYPIGTTSNGNARRLSKTVKAKSDKAAMKELIMWNIDLAENGYNELDSITFKHFYNDYWKKAAQENLEIKTYEAYNSVIQDRFLNTFANKKIKDIKPYEIKEVVVNAKRLKAVDKYGIELSRQTKKRILSAISNVFIVARDEYEIVKENPCNRVIIPKEKNAKRLTYEPYTSDEIALLFEKISDAPIRTKAILMTAFFTSARQGEIAALEERHFDFDNNEVLFDQRIIQKRDYSLERLDGLKSSDNKKMIVPSEYMDVMKEFISINVKLREELNIEDVEHKYIFGSPDGVPVAPVSLNRNWARFCKKHNLRKIRFHDFRHTSATYLISQNTPVKTVQERLGHKDYSTTMNIYAHALKEVDKKASDSLSKFI